MGLRDVKAVMGRRGLLAGVAALVATGLAKTSEKIAQAGGTQGTALICGESNTANVLTVLSAPGADHAVLHTVATSPGGDGFHGHGLGGGIPLRGIGVRGDSSWIGVRGDGGAYGVYGESAQGHGVQGTSTSSFGTRGQSTNSAGIFGGSTNGDGVWGSSSGRNGVYGSSTGGVGVLGYSQNFYGVFARSINSVALAATSPSYAGIFTGDVYITGRLTVASGAKSAAVKKSNGQHARVYCQESPEPWFEDFGRGKLERGQATIKLDADFAEIVKTDDYDVFLTEYGDHKALFVDKRTPTSFEVWAKGNPAASGAFGYRVVAKRKESVGARLERIDVPKLPEPPIPPAMPEKEKR